MAPDDLRIGGAARLTGESASIANRRLVVVSNRVGPIEAGQAASGGLAVALRDALRTYGGIWFGYSGEVRDAPGDTPRVTRASAVAHTVRPSGPARAAVKEGDER